MTVEETEITVAHLVQTMDRIDQWLRALRKGLEALPQDQEIEISAVSLEGEVDVKQPWIVKC